MTNTYTLGNNFLIETDLMVEQNLLSTLEQALLRVQERLQAFASEPEFGQKIELAFGEGVNADELRIAWQAGFSQLPRIEILTAAQINGASGAFAGGTNTIYLAWEYLSQNVENSQAIARVLLEEIGHFVDSVINNTDTAGDEGAIFSRLVQGETLNERQLESIKAEDDSATVTLDGQLLSIEQASGQPDYVNALLWPGEPRWNYPFVVGTPVTLDYEFMSSLPTYYNAKPNGTWVASEGDTASEFKAFSITQRQAAQQALNFWSDVSGIEFIEFTSGIGTLRFGTASRYGADGWAYPHTSENGIKGGDIWLKSNNYNNDNPTQGTYGFFVLLHEIGHALGLKHSFDNFKNTVPTLTGAYDSQQYTVMAYDDHPDMDNNVKPHTPLLYDIAAIQYLYGRNNNTRLGNDTYSWGTNTSYFGPDAAFIATIWDAGGIDTINAENGTQDAVINLEPGTFSSIGAWGPGIGSAKNNVSIAYGVTIENATGGSGSDSLFGNAVSNTLRGGSNKDYLYGYAGDDLLFGGSGNDYLSGDTGKDFFLGGDGNDSLYGVSDSDQMYGDAGDDLLFGGSENDSLNGGLNNDTLKGDSGNDYLFGGTATVILINTGDDILDGGLGFDTMQGQDGNDTYIVDSSLDVVIEGRGSGIDTVESSLSSYTLGANVENLKIIGTEASDGKGNDLDNAITGNDAANVLSGNFGNDTLYGGGGNDTAAGGPGIDFIYGGTGDDYLTGATDLDYLLGESGNDTYEVWSNVSGTDIADVFEFANDGIDTVRSYTSFTLGDNIENLELIEFGSVDVYSATGNALNNRIVGNTANNTLDGKAGVDALTGGQGNDIYIVDNTLDYAIEYADEGTDTYRSSASSFQMDSNVENLTMLSGAISATGTSIANTITGNAANNTLNGGAGNDTLIGGAGNDTYIIDSTGDTIVEAANGGKDTVLSPISYTLGSNVENLTLTGTSSISGTGNSFNNTITGNAANNTLNGGTGNDTLIGGAGNDTYIIDSTTDTITEAANAGTDTINANFTYNLAASVNIENLTLSGTGNINGTGTVGNNRITGNSGNNTLTGLDGNDTLDGGAGTDTLSGGNGDDVYLVNTTTDVIAETTGTDTINASITFSLANLAQIEKLTLIGQGSINGTGNTANNVITGNSGNNNLIGGDGNDTLNGNAGTDTLTGGLGNDTYILDHLTDSFSEAANSGTDTLQINLTYNLSSAPNFENLTLSGTGNINGTGTTGNNRITGNSGNNTLTGLDGNDTLDGGAGTDTLSGGNGNDTYIIDNSSDVITESANAGTDTVQSSVTYTLGTTLENLTLAGNSNLNATGNTANNTLTGNNGANTITGNDGHDILNGNSGNDTLVGGVGNDSMTGGSGQDFFVFNAPTQGSDRLNDFNVIDDTIRISANGFGSGLVAGASLKVNQFTIGSAATTAEQRFVYNSSTGALIFDANGNTTGGITQIATLSTGLAMTSADIFITA